MTEPTPTPATDYSILLRPKPHGCGWVRIQPTYEPPSCPEPPAYSLTSTVYPELGDGRACVEHTALMREMHPEWLAAVRSLRDVEQAKS